MSTGTRVRFVLVEGGGYMYGGEAGDYLAACGACGQTFEGPTEDLVTGAAAACEANDRRGTDFYDDPLRPPPTARFAGSDSERQSVGLPGHCERCAELGHVKAHPDLGCGDVGCNTAHGPDSP